MTIEIHTEYYVFMVCMYVYMYVCMYTCHVQHIDRTRKNIFCVCKRLLIDTCTTSSFIKQRPMAMFRQKNRIWCRGKCVQEQPHTFTFL
jgi:hypothetical protein